MNFCDWGGAGLIMTSLAGALAKVLWSFATLGLRSSLFLKAKILLLRLSTKNSPPCQSLNPHGIPSM